MISLLVLGAGLGSLGLALLSSLSPPGPEILKNLPRQDSVVEVAA